jgi:hypothetical protein
MPGTHKACWLVCLIIIFAAMLEIALGLCVIQEVPHSELGRLYLALGFITLCELACLDRRN